MTPRRALDYCTGHLLERLSFHPSGMPCRGPKAPFATLGVNFIDAGIYKTTVVFVDLGDLERFVAAPIVAQVVVSPLDDLATLAKR